MLLFYEHLYVLVRVAYSMRTLSIITIAILKRSFSNRIISCNSQWPDLTAGINYFTISSKDRAGGGAFLTRKGYF